MSSFYKRLISQKIISSVLNCQGQTNGQELVKRLAQIIKVQPIHKDSLSGSQLGIELSALAECLNGRSMDIDQLHIDEDVMVHAGQEVIHFRTDPGHFTKKVLEAIRLEKTDYGHMGQEENHKERICVEYSSPNIAKPFHVGHMRSTIIGNIIANMYEATGQKVMRFNYIGDWGTQFGLLSLGLQRYSDIKQLNVDPLLEFFRVYVKINQDVKSECGTESELTSNTYKEGVALFAKLERGDKDMIALWKMIRDLSLVELDKMYQRLGVHFTHTLSESNYRDKTQAVLQCLADVDLLRYDTDGVAYVELDNKGAVGRANVMKSDSSSLYLTRDIASALERQEKFTFDRVHYVVELGQRSHFVKLANILEKLGVPWAKRSIDDIHVRFGRVKGMSTRQGNIVFLRDVLDEAKSKMLDSITSRSTSRVSGKTSEEVADILGVTAIILQNQGLFEKEMEGLEIQKTCPVAKDVKGNRANDYTFSWDRMLSFKSDSGVFVQYCHARLCSMLSGCGVDVTESIDVSHIANTSALYSIVLHLARYPDVFQVSLFNLEPHFIVTYLFKLCHLINVAYATCPVKGEPTEIAQARLLVFVCARQVLANCLHVLGFKPLEKM